MLRIRLLTYCLAAAAALLTTACEDAPDYPDEPAIKFKAISAERLPTTTPGDEANLVKITVAYEDGDGDLGLSEADRQTSPFNDPNSEYRYNYYIKPFWYNQGNGRFEEYIFPTPGFNYNSVFERLLPEGSKPQPIRGDITFTPSKNLGLSIYTPEFRPGNRLRFEVMIIDRALHKSNTITTDEVVLK
jgi:hypothetical protein